MALSQATLVQRLAQPPATPMPGSEELDPVDRRLAGLFPHYQTTTIVVLDSENVRVRTNLTSPGPLGCRQLRVERGPFGLERAALHAVAGLLTAGTAGTRAASIVRDLVPAFLRWVDYGFGEFTSDLLSGMLPAALIVIACGAVICGLGIYLCIGKKDPEIRFSQSTH